ncbi:MAG: ParB N-terminal domain-containing protein [Chloroflexi bacterium]|nr:ParB N-terminal domain-containing protein [Chloroflexota bacterium]MDA8187554.1 ParB N-terminal domain-containing protein [Dehalococcoidales bacterium]
MAETLCPNPDGTYAMPEVVWIPLSNLERGPSCRTKVGGMEQLVNSIRQFGVLTPLWVRPHPNIDNRYVIFAGTRRYEAARRIARERCDFSLDSSIAVQIDRYVLPCRVFCDLAKVHQSLLALTENVARHDLSTVDTARELQRIKVLMETEIGRRVKVDDIIGMLSGKRADQKGLGKRQIYRLLRIAELDAGVAAAAKEHCLASDFLDHVARLPSKEEQIELIRLIVARHLHCSQVREIVQKKLSNQGIKISAIVLEVAPLKKLTYDPALVSRAIESILGGGQKSAKAAATTGNSADEVGSEIGELSSTTSQPTMAVSCDSDPRIEPFSLTTLIWQLRSQPSVDSMRAADVLETWAVSEGRWALSDERLLEQWLAELTDRGYDPDEIERLQTCLQKEEYSSFDVEIMRLLFACQGVLPEHLPGYVRQIQEAMSESAWFQALVRCAMELLAGLHQPEESKKVSAIARRLIDAIFYEFFWLSTIYDPRMQHHVEKLPPLRKKEFKGPSWAVTYAAQSNIGRGET